MRTPKLIPVSMKNADKHMLPGISFKKTYLCKIGGAFWVGQFTKVWFGLHFTGWGWGGIQFDAPGTNSSEWQAVWEIKR